MPIRTIDEIAKFKPIAKYNMEELAAWQRSIQRPSGGVLFARNVDGEQKRTARQRILDLFHPDVWSGHLSMVTMPGVHWRFERQLLAIREQGWMRRRSPFRTHFVGVENDRPIFAASCTQMPGTETPDRLIKPVKLEKYPFSELAYKTRFASFFFANIDDFMDHDWSHGENPGWDAAWLDYTGPLTARRLFLLDQFYHNFIHDTLIVTALNARWDRQTNRAIAEFGGHSKWLRKHLPGKILHEIEYMDSSPMVQLAVKKQSTKKETKKMTALDTLATGASSIIWRKGDPRSLLATIIAKNKNADEKQIHQLFWREIEDDKDLLRSCVEYFLDHNYRSIIRDTPEIKPRAEAKPTAKPTASSIASIKRQIKNRVANEARVVLLNWIMPNEKRLADCTGRDCSKMGGWLGQLAKKVPPGKKVGDILSEGEVKRIWRETAK